MAGRAIHADGQMAGQEQSDEVNAEADSGVFMACIFQAGKLGICAYDSTSAEVKISLWRHSCTDAVSTIQSPVTSVLFNQ